MRTAFLIGGGVALVVLLGVLMYLRDENIHGPFSPDQYFAAQDREARSLAADATLVRVTASYVKETGEIQAAFKDRKFWRNAGYLVGYYRSQLHAASGKRQNLPVGAPTLDPPASVSGGCAHVTTGMIRRGTFDTEGRWYDTGCAGQPVARPIHCKTSDIWQRALAGGAPHPAFANLSLTAQGWHFEIVDQATEKAVFSADYPDDCR